MADLFISKNLDWIKKERQKARLLRKTRWWREKNPKRAMLSLWEKLFPREFDYGPSDTFSPWWENWQK